MFPRNGSNTQGVPGVARQVVSGKQQTIVRYCYEPGAVFPEHQHPQEQVTIVLSGQLEFAIAGRRHLLAAGDLLVIPSGVPHGARVVGDEVVEAINTLSPRRDNHPGREAGAWRGRRAAHANVVQA